MIKARVITTIILVLLTFSICARQNSNDYYNQHAIGWHWYNESKEKKKKELLEQQASPAQKMKVLREEVENALSSAYLQPTTKNVENYIKLQNKISAKADKFSHVWQLVLLEHPELNFSITNPTNALGRQVFIAEHRKQEDKAISKLAEKSGLFFFYRGSCAYCHKFAPILKDFVERNKITLIPISLDGGILPEFPDSKIDNGQARNFNVNITPALFSVNPKTKKVIPVAFGLVSQEELRQRILEIAVNFDDSKVVS